METCVRDDHRLKMQRLVFYNSDINAINKVLHTLIQRSESKCTMLIDIDGHIITTYGDTDQYSMDALCTLLAGTFAATREWAKLLGEDEFNELYHQGAQCSILVKLIDNRALLTTIFGNNTQLGLVRLLTQEITKKLTEIFQNADNNSSEEYDQLAMEISNADYDGLLDNIFG